MSFVRVARTLAVTAVAGLLVGTTYGADAAGSLAAPPHQKVAVRPTYLPVHGQAMRLHCGLDLPS